MDFDLSEEQRLLKQSVERALGARYGDLKQRAAAQAEPKGYSAAGWRELAELGLTAIPFAEADGGLGQGFVETMIVAEALGAALALEPYLATIVLGGGALRHGAGADLRARLVPRIVDGTATLALATTETQSRYDLFDVATTARRQGDGSWLLEGEKRSVLHGDSADHIVVSARIAGHRRDTQGIALFLIDGKAAGISCRGYPTQDGLRGADLSLAGVCVPAEAVIGTPGRGLAMLDRVVDEGVAYLAAEAVGAMGALHALTLEYLKTRKQFGVPIGSFQVLQHKAADMFTALEQARSMAYYATMMAGEEDAVERRRAMAAAKVQIGRSGRFIGETATQLHGGIGTTMEYKGGHYFKHLAMIDVMFGDADHHLRELARAGGLIGAA